ncbi:MAG TPA: hypothetical protein VFV79_01930 [Saprospiraceae bacterium]|nr:hypothetical protein [Saprospiraceae bacterium]
MSRFSLLFFALFLVQLASAQWCGTPQDAIIPYLDANLANLVASQRGATKYIPVTFHLVADANGNGRVEEENVLKQVLNFNNHYADQDFIFYIDHFNYFNNDAVYNMPFSTLARTQMRIKRDNNSINIYICKSADDGSGPGTTLAYYDPQEDWIVTAKGEVNGVSKTLNHEVGHFFSLAHTHLGWDCHPYTLAEYNNPVTLTSTLPCEEGGTAGSVLIELHDRSNCATAGDKICDTPEDYNLGLIYDPGCDPNQDIRDKNNQLITPDVTNFMSYYSGCDTNIFSATQKQLINTDYFTPRRLYIRTGVVPKTTPVTEPVNYISPINGNESNGIEDIVLDWDDVPGANRYLIIYDRFQTFTFNPTKVFSNNSTYTIPGPLGLGQTIYWKVWPFNESRTGAMYSATQNFKVGEGTGINEIRDIQDYMLNPNPVANQQPVTLEMAVNQSFAADLKIIGASNRVLYQEKVNIPSGQSSLPIKTEGLSAGVYFVTLNAISGRLVEKMLILE